MVEETIRDAPSTNVFLIIRRYLVDSVQCLDAIGMEDDLEEMRKSSRLELFRKMSCKSCVVELSCCLNKENIYHVQVNLRKENANLEMSFLTKA